jgi:hypothetical protein
MSNSTDHKIHFSYVHIRKYYVLIKFGGMKADSNNITINNQRVKVYKFDTPFSVLERYSSIINASKTRIDKPYVLQTLPQFLRFTLTTQDFYFENDKNYEIEDVREVRNMSLDLFLKSIEVLSSTFTNLQPKEIIFIYIIEKGYSSVSIEDFGRIYTDDEFGEKLKRLSSTFSIEGRVFSNYRITYISVGKYVSYVASQSRKIQGRAKSEENVFDSLSKLKPVELNEFVIEGTIEELTLHFGKETSLYSIFDELSASFIIPFIVFSDGKTLFYKIYKHIRPIAEWLDIGHRPDHTPVIYFYVLDEPENNNNSKRVLTKELLRDTGDIYRGGVWLSSPSSILNHVIRVDSRGAVTYVHDILGNLKTHIPFDIVNETQYETRGKFSVSNNTFNKAVFAALITNDPVFSHLLYLDERSKSILEKKRFVYYHDSQHMDNGNNNTTLNTLTITMTDSVTETGSHIDVRISRAATENQIHQFMVLFSYMFSMYLQKKEDTINKYTKLYNTINFKKYERKVTIKRVDIKTGKRLKLLEQHNPAAFKHGGYSSKCQPKRRQPYLVPKSEIKNVKKKFETAEPKEIAKELEKYGMLNWPEGSDDWYACYPRESDDDEKRHIWPGLIKQNPKAGNYDKYPLLPCCFISNQFTKKGSKKATDSKVTEQENIEDVFDRPLSSNKATPQNRYAELPYYMQNIVENAGYSQVEYRTKKFLPILRYGVIESLDSMVHCIERAVNEDYATMNTDDKKARVRDVLDRLSKKNDDWLVVCRQEMYNYTYEEIQSELLNPGTYIDPDMYINLFAKFYDCNIIIFKMDDGHPKGDVSLPRFSKAYLSYKFNPKTETVVIVKVQSQRARVGTVRGIYQCELVVKYENGKVQYLFESKDKFIKKCFSIFSKVNDVFITSPDDMYITYNPQILL